MKVNYGAQIGVSAAEVRGWSLPRAACGESDVECVHNSSLDNSINQKKDN
jgi:hypothetical protein